MSTNLFKLIRDIYQTTDGIPLHAPSFGGNEKKYVIEAIDSTFVSSVGKFVDQFELEVSGFVDAQSATATVNGTAALHVALLLAGVQPGDLVLTQPLTFIATCNAIAYSGAEPVFVDVDRATLGLSAHAAEIWLQENAEVREGGCFHKDSGRIVRACLPMHTFGHPVDVDGLLALCAKWHLVLVEDAAESLGSYYKGRHTGTFGIVGTLSFNGNKVITTGGGGMIIGSKEIGKKAKHLTTTAKIPHAYEYAHDLVGYNYRLPNLNAALGCAQMESLPAYLASKRQIASRYRDFFSNQDVLFVDEPESCQSNFWLNAVICPDVEYRNSLLRSANSVGIGMRPIWQLMNNMPAFKNCLAGSLETAHWLEQRVVNLPSSPV